MRLSDIRKLVASTADAAFAVDGGGTVVAWNDAAEALLETAAREALGAPCRELVCGADECGLVCTESCTVLQAVRHRHPIANFDVQLSQVPGKPWCNVYVLQVEGEHSAVPFAVHLLRSVDIRKRLELAMRDFVAANACLPAEQVQALFGKARTPVRAARLTSRELEVLRRVAGGASAGQIAGELHISPVTVKNHIQHVLDKLDVSSRVLAVLRAEHAGLL